MNDNNIDNNNLKHLDIIVQPITKKILKKMN